MAKKHTPEQAKALKELQAIFVEEKDGSLTPFLERTFDKEDMLWDLNGTIEDVERQVDEIWRWRYYGEAHGKIVALLSIGWLDMDEGDEWKAKLKNAFDNSCRNDGAVDSGERPHPRWNIESD